LYDLVRPYARCHRDHEICEAMLALTLLPTARW